ncbi:uncharacterized protein BJ171DRAFT_597610 [Polychytrium aggregatum]|uniref:uncharacterized protein n=1 Tax=Polychytrium aggregatum TaxID=110093 RepID=UPI0022FF0E47|nr:uncharacterized protein BJ171DRAFT_597610 [Polychytrium aggregatum]KAI9206465.1 hypothetical protein BJ171DRAFT_597610 [Polychytrium aggregatum]
MMQPSPLTASSGIVSSEILPDINVPRMYILALMNVIQLESPAYPAPEDFLAFDGFEEWSNNPSLPRPSFQDILMDYLQSNCLLSPQDRGASRDTAAHQTLNFTAVKASDLAPSPDGHPRNPYCMVQIEPSLPSPDGQSANELAGFVTDAVSGTTSPVWDQHISLEIKSIADQLVVCVFDKSDGKKKDEHLGQVTISVMTIVRSCASVGLFSGWWSLGSKPTRKGKDKAAECGQIYLEFCLDRAPKKISAAQPAEKLSAIAEKFAVLQQRIMSTKLRNLSLYRHLLRSTLTLELTVNRDRILDVTKYLLGNEANQILKYFARVWGVGHAFQQIMLVELLFSKYQSFEIPLAALWVSQKALYDGAKQSGWITVLEREYLSNLLSEMAVYFTNQVKRYKELFPKNTPPTNLYATFIMLRMIKKNDIYREAHPETNPSFRLDLQHHMVDACKARYRQLSEHSRPFDRSDHQAVIEGYIRLTESLVDDINLDVQYFADPFKRELDIVAITVSIYQYMLKTSLLGDPDISNCSANEEVSELMFQLHERVQSMEELFGKESLLTGSRPIPTRESIFQYFVSSWIDELLSQAPNWVSRAIDLDEFSTVVSQSDTEAPACSSSALDVMSLVEAKLMKLLSLKWDEPEQKYNFILDYSKVIHAMVTNYVNEIKKTCVSANDSITGILHPIYGSRESATVLVEVCLKLSNLDYLVNRLYHIHSLLRDAVDICPSTDQNCLGGKLSVSLVKIEDVEDNASLRINFVMPTRPWDEACEGFDEPPTLLHVEYADSSIDGPPTVKSFPTAARLEVQLIAKSGESPKAAEVIGKAYLELKKGSSLRNILEDYNSHELSMEMRPRGKLTVMMQLHRNPSDISTWLSHSRAEISSSIVVLIRYIASLVAPDIRGMMEKAIRDQEAAPAKRQRGVLGVFAGIQYSQETVDGHMINVPATMRQVEESLSPFVGLLEDCFKTICAHLSTRLSNLIIKKIWIDFLLSAESLLLPPLAGSLTDRDRKLWNSQQLIQSSSGY